MNTQKISFLREPKIVDNYDKLFQTTKIDYTVNADGLKNIIASVAVSEFLELKTDINKIKDLIETKHEFVLLLKRYFISILDNYEYNSTFKLSPEELEKTLEKHIILAYHLIIYPIYSYRSYEFGLYVLLNIWKPVLLSSEPFYDFASRITHESTYHLILEKEQNIDRADLIQKLLIEFKELIQLKEKYIEINHLKLSFLIKQNLNYCYNNFDKIKSILVYVKHEINKDLYNELSRNAQKERKREERNKGMKRNEDENENNNDNGLNL